jgi:hypothetical protein
VSSEHQLGALSPGQLADLCSGQVVIDQHLVGTRSHGLLELVGGLVDDDDLRRRQRAEELHGHLAQPARTDDHRGGTRLEPPERMLDRVIGSQPRVGQRCRLDGVEVTNRDQQARGGHEHVLGQPAIEPESTAGARDLGGTLAVVLPPEPTRLAAAAAPRPVDDHRIARRQPAHAGADLLHPASVLMAEGKGQPPLNLTLGPLQDV